LKTEKRYWYLARRAAVEQMSSAEIMDMLRYDAARVECNPPDGFYLMSKLQEGGYPPPQKDRWASFWVRIVLVGIGKMPPEPRECVRLFEADERMSPAKEGGVR
jgi:hypothetical protein